MATIKYQELQRRCELDGPEKTTSHLCEALGAGQLRAEDFSLRDLAEGLVPDGRQWVRMLDPRNSGSVSILETGVDVTFLNVTGQVIYSKILESYTQEAFVVSKLVDTIPTRLGGEKIPGTGWIKDEAEVHPGIPHPHVGFGEDYIETPSTAKHGLIVPVTKEAIFFDRTHLVLGRAAEIGEVLGLNKEKRLIDIVIGQANNYEWKGISYDTYQSSTPWINVLVNNELIDWTDVDTAERLFANNTGEPILVQPNAVLVMPAYRHAAHKIFRVIQATVADTPINYTVADSRLAYRRVIASGETAADAKKWWFIGDFQKAFAYIENWPITVAQSPVNSDADFNRDIVVRFKASERGTAAVLNPRYVVKCTGP